MSGILLPIVLYASGIFQSSLAYGLPSTVSTIIAVGNTKLSQVE